MFAGLNKALNINISSDTLVAGKGYEQVLSQETVEAFKKESVSRFAGLKVM